MTSVLSLRGQIWINKPVQDVSLFIADYRNDCLWRDGVESVQYTTPEPVGQGSQFVERFTFWSLRMVMWWEVTDYEPGGKIVCRTFRSDTPLVSPLIVSTRMLRRKEGGTELDYRLEIDAGSSLLCRIMLPIVRGSSQAMVDRHMRQLKSVLEV